MNNTAYNGIKELEIEEAAKLGEIIRPTMSAIFTEGFYQWLKFFVKDQEKLVKAFTHMFQLEVFYVGFIDGIPAGIAACTDGQSPSVKLKLRPFWRYLGFIRGTLAYVILKKQFEKHAYPFEIKAGTVSVEFVVVASQFQGQGVGFALLEHIHNVTAHEKYVLEVADTNEAAVKLYRKLGYEERERLKQKHAKHSGINFLLYMQFKKE